MSVNIFVMNTFYLRQQKNITENTYGWYKHNLSKEAPFSLYFIIVIL